MLTDCTSKRGKKRKEKKRVATFRERASALISSHPRGAPLALGATAALAAVYAGYRLLVARAAPLKQDVALQMSASKVFGALLLALCAQRHDLRKGELLPAIELTSTLTLTRELVDAYLICCSISPLKVFAQSKRLSSASLLAAAAAGSGAAQLPFPVSATAILCFCASLVTRICAHPRNKLKALGSVNTKVVIEQYVSAIEIDPSKQYAVTARLVPQYRMARRGIEADIEIMLTDPATGVLLWKAVFTMLAFQRVAGSPTSSPSPADHPQEQQQQQQQQQLFDVDVPATAGVSFARLSSDYNPIHVSNIGARLFGFPSAIAHGMWTVGHVAGKQDFARYLLDRSSPQSACLRIEAKFVKPVLLGKTLAVACQWDAEQQAASFAVTLKNVPKYVAIVGSFAVAHAAQQV